MDFSIDDFSLTIHDLSMGFTGRLDFPNQDLVWIDVDDLSRGLQNVSYPFVPDEAQNTFMATGFDVPDRVNLVGTYNDTFQLHFWLGLLPIAIR